MNVLNAVHLITSNFQTLQDKEAASMIFLYICTLKDIESGNHKGTITLHATCLTINAPICSYSSKS